MDVDLLSVADCPNVNLVRERIAAAAAQAGVVVDLHEREVLDDAEAIELGMRGSPTVLLAGVDISGSADAGPASVSCRLYRSDTGVEGAPTVAELVAAFSR